MPVLVGGRCVAAISCAASKVKAAEAKVYRSGIVLLVYEVQKV
jgi:hypothetical protein